MKLLAVFVLCLAFACALPTQPEEPQKNQVESLLSADVDSNGDNTNDQRNKRFIFFSKIFYPFPYITKVVAAPAVVAQPVVTPIVTKTKVVAEAPAVTYQVKPITYQYTYSVPSFTVVKTAPVATSVQVDVPAVSATVTKTAAVATEDSNDDA